MELATSLSIAIHNIYRLSVTTKVIRHKARYNYLLTKIWLTTKFWKKRQPIRCCQAGMDTVLMREFGISREDMAKNLSFYLEPNLSVMTRHRSRLMTICSNGLNLID